MEEEAEWKNVEGSVKTVSPLDMLHLYLPFVIIGLTLSSGYTRLSRYTRSKSHIRPPGYIRSSVTLSH